MLPATTTKHKKLLVCPFADSVFHLHQSDDGVSNGTALWLGAQCLSAYLAYSAVVKPGMRAIELGSGIGLTSLALAHLGCHTIATDLPWVIAKCLAKNIENNRARLPSTAGELSVRELDWTIPPDQWVFDHDTIIASPACSPPEPQQYPHKFDIIVSADTVYSRELVTPFLRTLHALCTSSAPRIPMAFICIERRDNAVIDQMLQDAQSIWCFAVTRVPPRKLSKALEKSGCKWAKDDWDGVELWKLTYRG
ncbi:hypothetical protein B0H16DRAFT_1508260 [Mycena metata]|uniref:Methyltransferase-domain-containing protein n=1 Tax=Mycena metata TaxID=1033252 RepID=A0AAD7NT22_9AGAR|nr:hypothetical protein B0H16DRAFT_1508260 [Mycena metata]